MKSIHASGVSIAALAVCLAVSAPAMAATAAADAPATAVTEVVVTGSYIAGTPKDAALPVDILTQATLEKRGTPTVLELIKELPASGPTIGESNQFPGTLYIAGPPGSASTNLRGLGPLRTLTLFNGHRFAPVNVTDINLLPSAAVGRVEVLKDGAAATYGSDAIGGVINFITRKNLNGLELSGDYRYVSGSDGDWTDSVAWGKAADWGNVLLTFGYQHRSELQTTQRSWAIRPITENDIPYSSFSDPGGWTGKDGPNGTGSTTGFFNDGAAVGTCSALNGAQTYSPTLGAVCKFDYVPFDNLIEEESRYQFYGESNLKLGASNTLHLEALYARTDTPHWHTSPGYLPLNGPNGPGTPFTVPSSNPGFAAFLIQAGASAAQIAGTQSVTSTLWRPFALGSNPLTGTGNEVAYWNTRAMISAGLKGDLGWQGVGYDVNLTYSRTQDVADGGIPAGGGADLLTYNVQQALNGFGGPSCTGNVPGANGCQYFNPFATALFQNTALGGVNPNYDSTKANSAALIKWMYGANRTTNTYDYLVLDAVLHGKLGVSLPGGQIGWAVGGQYRRTVFDLATTDGANLNIHPCAKPGDVVGSATCPVAQGPYTFLGPVNPLHLQDSVWAMFGEINLPVTDTLNVQGAIRYEDYGGATGSTVNYKVAGKWQVIPAFALRASVGTTFRGPTPQDRANSGTAVVTNFPVANSTYKAVDLVGNPNIGPEQAFTVDVGGVFQVGRLTAILDYWYYDLEHQIVSPPAIAIANSVVPGAVAGALVNCSAPAIPLITFTGGVCTQGVTKATDIQRVRSQTTNGPPVHSHGLDFDISYSQPDVYGGAVNLGANATYIIDYVVDEFDIGQVVVNTKYDAVGLGNFTRLPGPVPHWKAQAYVEYNRGIMNLRVTEDYFGGFLDERPSAAAYVQTAPGAACPVAIVGSPPANCSAIFAATKPYVDPFFSTDIVARFALPHDVTVTASVLNAFDRDPSFARIELGYSPSTGNPYGRTFKFSIKKKF